MIDISYFRKLLAKGTPRPWKARDFEVYPSEGHVNASCDHGCDGGCDDDGPIVCAQIWHASEVIADVYGLRQFAEADGKLIAGVVNALPALLDELERLKAALLEIAEYECHCGCCHVNSPDTPMSCGCAFAVARDALKEPREVHKVS